MMNRREALRRVALLMGGTMAAPTVAGVLGGCRTGTDTSWTPAILQGPHTDLVRAMVEHILPETNTPGARDAGVTEFIDRMLAEWYPEALRQRFLDGLAMVDQRAQEMNGNNFLDLAADQQRRLIAEIDRETFQGTPEPIRDDVREETEGGGEDPLDEPVDEPGDDPYGAADSARAQGGATPEMGRGAGAADSALVNGARDSTRAGSSSGRRLSPDVDELLARQIEGARERAARRAASAPYVRGDVAHEGSLIGDPSFFQMMKELTLVGYYTSEAGATEELTYEPVPGVWEGCVPYEDIGSAWSV